MYATRPLSAPAAAGNRLLEQATAAAALLHFANTNYKSVQCYCRCCCRRWRLLLTWAGS
jgi:hypothetical protein